MTESRPTPDPIQAQPYRRDVLVRLTFVGMLIALGLAGIMWWFDYSAGTVGSILLVAAAGVMINRVIASARSSLLAHSIASASYILALVLVGINLGGLPAGVTPWLAIGPVLTLAYGERRVVKQSLVMTCAAVIALGVYSYTLPGGPEQVVRLLMQVGSVIAAALYAFRAASDQDRLRTRALVEMQTANDRLTAELDEHRRTRAELQQATDQLVTTARAAGMAEVATGVLHNLGNALNSVNVSVALTQQQLKDDTSERLSRLAEQLDTAETETVRRYLLAIADRHEQRRAQLVSDADGIRERMDHAATIVQAQQVYARSSGLVSEVSLEDVVAQAVALVPGLSGAHVVIDIVVAGTTPCIHTERHKLLQILANLVANARDAVRDTDAPVITIRAEPRGETVHICVTDNGDGIEPAHLTRLFQHGFTTKAAGNGFGLHASALAASELGGHLAAHSQGMGQGATFELVLPLQPHDRSGRRT